jgi:hypothetical protein
MGRLVDKGQFGASITMPRCNSQASVWRAEDIEERHPMAGDRWMIQCKRKKDIGPKKLAAILDDVDESDPPWGYILAAAANFSKQSYRLCVAGRNAVGAARPGLARRQPAYCPR